jgi:flagellar biogenesis protein FliO
VRPTKPLELAPQPSSSRLGTGLVAIAALVGAGFWFLKKRQAKPAAAKRTIEIIARRTIGVRSELLVVEIDGHGLLIGVTPGAIQRLAVLPDAEGERLADEEPEADVEPGFRVAGHRPEPASDRRPESLMPPTQPEPRRLLSTMATSRAPRSRRDFPVEEQVRGLVRDRRAP